ncbi:MAG: hypothetical protein WAW88_12290 [Nocardioides sp.]
MNDQFQVLKAALTPQIRFRIGVEPQDETPPSGHKFVNLREPTAVLHAVEVDVVTDGPIHEVESTGAKLVCVGASAIDEVRLPTGEHLSCLLKARIINIDTERRKGVGRPLN